MQRCRYDPLPPSVFKLNCDSNAHSALLSLFLKQNRKRKWNQVPWRKKETGNDNLFQLGWRRIRFRNRIHVTTSHSDVAGILQFFNKCNHFLFLFVLILTATKKRAPPFVVIIFQLNQTYASDSTPCGCCPFSLPVTWPPNLHNWIEMRRLLDSPARCRHRRDNLPLFFSFL